MANLTMDQALEMARARRATHRNDADRQADREEAAAQIRRSLAKLDRFEGDHPELFEELSAPAYSAEG